MHDDPTFPVATRLRQDLAPMAPTLGGSPAHMDTPVSPCRDCYRPAAGQWQERTEIHASEAAVGGFSKRPVKFDRQLLERSQDPVAANGAPGSPRPQSVALRVASAQG